MQGSADRTKDLANFFHDSLGLPFDGKEIGKTERYSMCSYFFENSFTGTKLDMSCA